MELDLEAAVDNAFLPQLLETEDVGRDVEFLGSYGLFFHPAALQGDAALLVE